MITNAYNHTFTIRPMPQVGNGIMTIFALRSPASEVIECPCGHRIYSMGRLWSDEAVIECPNCKDWHSVIWR